MVQTLFKVAAAGALLIVLAASCSPASTPAYVSLGDSLAVGVGASDPRERGYAPLYHKLLQESVDQEMAFVQLGVGGETSCTKAIS